MQNIPRLKVKICCISSKEEAQTAIQFGANAIGLVGPMPSGPGVISNELIAEIAASTPPVISTFLLTSETESEQIIKHHQKVLTNTIQLVDSVTSTNYSKIRMVLPNVKLVQVIHVLDEKSVDEAIQAAEFVDYLLLDSGNPNLKIKELGGTGRTHDWRLSRKIRDAIHIPLFLAGGLNAENVQGAVEQINPHGVDLCSGVRTNSQLDKTKLEKFFTAIEKIR